VRYSARQRLALRLDGLFGASRRAQRGRPRHEQRRDDRMVVAEQVPSPLDDLADRHLAAGGVDLETGRELLKEVVDRLRAGSLLAGLDQAHGRQRQADDEGGRDERGRRDAQAMPLDELAEPVQHARGPGHHGLAREIPLDVGGELAGRLVAPRAVLLHRLHHDPVEVAAHEAAERPGLGLLLSGGVRAFLQERVETRGGPGRFHVPNNPLDLAVAGLAERDRVERRRPRKQLVQQHPQRVDVGPRVDVEAADLGLVRAHVLRRPDEVSELGEQGLLGQPVARCLGDAEVDHLGHGLRIVQRHEHVRRLEIAVDDALLVGVLDRTAHVEKEVQTLACRELAPVGVLDDGDALDQLHHEVGPARLGGPGL
jgi:hypothetical protein